MSLDLHLCPPHPPAQVICTSLFHHLTAHHPCAQVIWFIFDFVFPCFFIWLLVINIHAKVKYFFCISLFYCPKAQHLHLQRWIVSLLFFPFVFLDLIARHVWLRVKQEIPLSHISQTYISRVKQEIPLSYILSAQHMFQRHWYRRVLPIHSGPRGGSWQVLDCHLYPLYLYLCFCIFEFVPEGVLISSCLNWWVGWSTCWQGAQSLKGPLSGRYYLQGVACCGKIGWLLDDVSLFHWNLGLTPTNLQVGPSRTTGLVSFGCCAFRLTNKNKEYRLVELGNQLGPVCLGCCLPVSGDVRCDGCKWPVFEKDFCVYLFFFSVSKFLFLHCVDVVTTVS